MKEGGRQREMEKMPLKTDRPEPRQGYLWAGCRADAKGGPFPPLGQAHFLLIPLPLFYHPRKLVLAVPGLVPRTS